MKKNDTNFLLIVIVILVLVFFRNIDALVFGQVNQEDQLFIRRFSVLGLTYNLRALTLMVLGFLMARPSPKIMLKTNVALKYSIFIVLLLLSNIYLLSTFMMIPSVLMRILNDRSTIVILRIFTGYFLGIIVGRDR